MKAPFVIGRVMFGGYFVYNGIQHFLEGEKLAKYAEAKHVPQPDLAVKASGVALMVGGASILLGIKPKLGAAALVGFLAAASTSMHAFWDDEDPRERQNNMIHFAKNLALAGGALALAGVEEPWPASIGPSRPGLLERAARTASRILPA